MLPSIIQINYGSFLLAKESPVRVDSTNMARSTFGKSKVPWWPLLAFLFVLVRTNRISAFGNDIVTPKASPIIVGKTWRTRREILGYPASFPAIGMLTGFLTLPNPSKALFFESNDHRQLELCIVAILRLQYWVLSVAETLKNSDVEDKQKQAYLEARLGCKAVVAPEKLGGAVPYYVYSMKGLQIKDTLKDLKWYSKSKRMDRLRDDLIESLASVVEFDGLETTQDPSPRPALTLSMYNQDKGTYVYRMLTERIVPITEEIVTSFGPDVKAQCEDYIRQYYANELPPGMKAVDAV